MTTSRYKMAFFYISDINLEIISWVVDLKLFINLSTLDKKSYELITKTLIYTELDTLKTDYTIIRRRDTRSKFGKKIITQICCKLGLINILKNMKYSISNDSIFWASSNGHVNILEWLKNSRLELKYTSNAIDCASCNGHVNILEWFKNSGLEFKYSQWAIDDASENGHVNILEW